MNKLLTLIISLFLITGINAQEKIQASDIIAKINKNEAVILKNVIVVGDLDLTELSNMELMHSNDKQYRSIVKSELSFTDCVFSGEVLAFKWIEITKTSYRTDFYEKISFINCKFQEQCSYRHSSIKKESIFTGSVFSGSVDFRHTGFNRSAFFNNCVFSGSADFRHTGFNGIIEFSNCQFKNSADFRHTGFNGSPNYENTVFDKGGDFRHAGFSKGVNFNNVRFMGAADFRHTGCSGKAQTEGIVFKNGVDTRHSDIFK